MDSNKLSQLQERCKTDLKWLVTKVMQMPRWSDQLHNDLADTVNSPGDRKLLLLPRGHQKSTIISVGWTIQQILKDPNIRVSLISSTWKLSKDLLHQIKAVMEQSALKDIFGSFVAPHCRWTVEAIDVAQRTRWVKDPTVSTAGLDTGKTGSHCDLMIFDDPVSPENITTQEQIRKTISGYQDCLPLLDPGGRVVVIGTRYSNADLYAYLIENEARSINGVTLETEEQRKQWRTLCAK